MTVSIEIKESKQKSLVEIARKQGKSLEAFIGELLDNYVSEKENTTQLMKLSEVSFKDWDNEEDAVYDNL